MIKSGIRNGEISKHMSLIGEGDVIVISGCRFSVPEGVKLVDLAVTDNLPKLDEVLRVITENCTFSESTVAHEMDNHLKEEIEPLIHDLKNNELTYRQLQVVAKNARVVIRTGDMSEAGVIVLRV